MADPEVHFPGQRLEDEANPKSREAFPEEEEEEEEDVEEEEDEEEEEDSVGDLLPEGCLGAGCRSKVEVRSSEMN